MAAFQVNTHRSHSCLHATSHILCGLRSLRWTGVPMKAWHHGQAQGSSHQHRRRARSDGPGPMRSQVPRYVRITQSARSAQSTQMQPGSVWILSSPMLGRCTQGRPSQPPDVRSVRPTAQQGLCGLQGEDSSLSFGVGRSPFASPVQQMIEPVGHVVRPPVSPQSAQLMRSVADRSVLTPPLPPPPPPPLSSLLRKKWPNSRPRV